jgi:hypothetical protein
VRETKIEFSKSSKIVNSIGKIGETEVAVVNLTKEKVLIRISDDGEE